ncbi:hypothetical protein BV25DRAFT_1826631 [Artomyces pyxidatus]|uniref:Uncharacterized protein n=1 Tax=Artomyces pyxidatus TaxID=48021 RepID=A0ACB8SZG7_9AGAM|nr:hypothetical protein BV25DRAFT_1826631 [Artomyces pyxidatus]
MSPGDASVNGENFWSVTVRSRLSALTGDPSLQTSDVATDLRNLLLKERSDFLQELHTINGHINALSRTSRLPAELLAYVFSFCAADSKAWREMNAGIGWVVVTHVCRRWRHIALSHPRLWRYLDFPLSLSWAQEMISRSKAIPCIVSWISGYPRTGRPPSVLGDGFNELALSQLHGIEQLRLDGFDGTTQSLEAVLALPAPDLTTVDIKCKGLFLPPNIFDGIAPRLRNVSVVGCLTFPWTSPILQNVVNLKVEGEHLSFILSTRTELLSALQAMRALEKLALVSCLPDSPTLAHTTSHVIAPPNLQYLELCGDLFPCADILRHVRIPHTGIKLRLQCETSGTANDFEVLFPFIVAAGGTPPKPFACIEVETQSRTCFVLDGERSPVNDIESWERGPNGPNLQLFLDWSVEMGWTAVDLLQAACKAVSVDHLQYLTVDIEEFSERWNMPPQKFDLPVWLDTFGRAKELHFVKTWGHAGHSLCEALSQASHDGGHWQSTLRTPLGPLFMPALKTLRLYMVRFSHLFVGGQLKLRKFLPLVLQARNLAGAPRLDLEMSTCSQKMEDELKELVDSFDLLQEPESDWDNSGSDEESQL